MSIEKLDFSYVKQAHKGFTVFLNDVIQNIPCGLTLGIYVYLSTLPPEWSVNREHLMNHFSIGRDRVKAALSWLHENHLLDYEQERTAGGVFGICAIVIKDGREFIEMLHSTGGLKNRRTDLPVDGETAPIKETKIIKKETKTINSSNDQDLFDQFWAAHPKKVCKDEARKAWAKKKIAGELIIADVIERTEKDWRFRELRHIPNPSTYLNQCRWTDAILPPAAPPVNKTVQPNSNTPTSTVKWFNDNH